MLSLEQVFVQCFLTAGALSGIFDILRGALSAPTFVRDMRMVAYDSRRTPDPANLLHPETIAALKAALEEQRRSGVQPVPSLTAAIRAAARESRDRCLPPEMLIIQLKAVADEVGMPPVDADRNNSRAVREWMVSACLHAYWELES